MQDSAVEQVLTSLRGYFPQADFVDRVEDGFDDALRYVYIRKQSEDGNNYEVDDDWLVGTYVAVAESDEDGLLTRLWSLVELSDAGAEVIAAGDVAEEIYKSETGQNLQRDCNIATVTFTLRTEALCMSC